MTQLDERLEDLARSMAEPIDPDLVLERVRRRSTRRRWTGPARTAGIAAAALVVISLALYPVWSRVGRASRNPGAASPAPPTPTPTQPFTFHGTLIVSGRPVGTNGGQALYLVTQTGLPRALHDDAKGPSWSPDGVHVAATRVTSDSPTGELVTIDTRSGQERVLTTFDVPSGAAWSPSGDLIAFSTQHGRIHLIRPDGSGLRQVTAPGSNCLDTSPTWSPDGVEVVFFRDCVSPTGVEHAADSGMYSVRLDGTNLTVISTRSSGQAAWSPGGTTIAFSARNPNTHTFSVYAVGADGTGEKVLISDASSPVWAPDGSVLGVIRSGRILFLSPSGSIVGQFGAADSLQVSGFGWSMSP